VTQPATRPRSRAWWKYLLTVTGLGLLCLAGGLWYVTSDSFQDLVRRRMIAELERITGGRVEIGSIHTIPFRMQVDVREITVHGREAATDVPLAHADRLVARVKGLSLLRSEFGFHELTLDHPVIHLAFSPDGTSNVPGPSVARASEVSSIQQLFALSIDNLYIRHGLLLWDDKNIPLDLAANDAGIAMEYSFLQGHYESRVLLGKVDSKFDGFRPIAWMADLKFTLTPTFAEIESLKFNSGRSRAEVRGLVRDFRHPQITATYDAHVDLGEVASITRRQDFREGVIDFKGQGKWSVEDFAASGALEVRDFGWQDARTWLKKVNLTSDFAVTDQQIRLTKLQGKTLGGTFAGDALVDNWLHSAPFSAVSSPSSSSNQAAQAAKKKAGPEMAIITAGRPTGKGPREKLPGVQVASLHLRVRDVSVMELVAALKPIAPYLRNSHLAAVAGGTVEAGWRGSPRVAEVKFDSDAEPPAKRAAGEIALTAHGHGGYHWANDVLEFSQLNVSTPDSRGQASGTISSSSNLRFSVVTSDFEEWRPIITALVDVPKLPFRVHGTATFNGSVGGDASAPTVTGILGAQDFDITLPATGHAQQRQVSWDALSTWMQFSSRSLTLRDGNLRRGGTTATFEANASLEDGAFTVGSPFTAHVNLYGVDAALAQEFLGYDYPISGDGDAVLQLSGTRSNPRVQGQIHARNASAWGESIRQFDADLLYAEGETALDNLQLFHEDSEIRGSAAYKPSTDAFRLNLVGKNFDLSHIPQIQSRLLIEGRGDFTLQGSGTTEAPAINASAQLRGLTLDHELTGELNLQGVTKGGELRLTGQSEFAKGTLQIDGGIQMRGDYAANISFQMNQVDLDALWRAYLKGKLTGHSAVSGVLAMQGPLRHPRLWTLNGNLSGLSLDVDYTKLHNADPMLFTYAQQKLHIDQLHLAGEGIDLAGRGSVQFAGSRELDVSVDGKVDMKLLNSVDQDFTGAGTLSMDMALGGTLSDPLPQGHLQVINGSVNYAGLPSGLSEMNGSLVFTRDRLHIEKMTARTGGGTIDLKGDATHYNQKLNFDVTAIGKEVRLRYPPGVSSTANAELHWVGTPESSSVTGEIMVTKLAVTPNFDFSSYLESTRRNAATMSTNSPLYGVKLDVHVQTAPELQMKTAVARLSGDADLRLRGSVARPAVIGRADILEGDATFNGTKFRLERGDITFANPVAIEPQLNLEASTHVRNYDLDITVTGTPERLAVNYRSEPPLPKSDIIALLALGRTSAESEQLQQQSGVSPYNDEASALIINQAMNSTVSSRVDKLFGVSRIKIDPQGLTTETNPTARGPQVTIEQQFANNISFTYSTNVSQSNQQIIQGEYFFTRNVSAVGTRDQNGVVSFDLRIRRRK
jgi:translocation and assembly module TamB